MPGPALFRGDPRGDRETHGTDTRIIQTRTFQNNASEAQNRTEHEPTSHLGTLLTADPVTDPGSPTRALRPRALRLRPVRAFSPPRAPHTNHTDASRDKFSVWGGRGQGAAACRVPIRSAQSRSPHSRVRDGHGAYRLCCGLACGDDAASSAPPRLRGRARAPDPAAAGPRVPRIAGIGTYSLTSPRATRTPRKRRRAKTPTRTAGRPKTLTKPSKLATPSGESTRREGRRPVPALSLYEPPEPVGLRLAAGAAGAARPSDRLSDTPTQ